MVDPGSSLFVTRLGLRLPSGVPGQPGQPGQPGPPDPARTRRGPTGSSAPLRPAADGPFERLASIAVAAEAGGFDSLWVGDRVLRSGEQGEPADPVFEAYSLLGALAARTRTAGLAALPDGAGSRPPSLLAKIAAGLDVIAHGRAIVAFGVEPGDDPAAVARLAEELQVCRALLTEESPSFAGRYFELRAAVNRPRPVRPGGIPLVVVTDRLDVVDTVARWADAMAVTGDSVAVAGTTAQLGERAVAVGRDPGAVRVIWTGAVATDGPAAGSDQLVDEIGRLMAAGAYGCVVSCGGADDPETVTRVGRALRGVVAPPP